MGHADPARKQPGPTWEVGAVEWPILADLAEDDRARVLAATVRRNYARGETIVHQGDPGGAFHLLAEGRVAVRVSTPEGEVVTLSVLGQGDFFGEQALLGARHERTASVVALERVETFSMAGRSVRRASARLSIRGASPRRGPCGAGETSDHPFDRGAVCPCRPAHVAPAHRASRQVSQQRRTPGGSHHPGGLGEHGRHHPLHRQSGASHDGGRGRPAAFPRSNRDPVGRRSAATGELAAR